MWRDKEIREGFLVALLVVLKFEIEEVIKFFIIILESHSFSNPSAE
jgi:hypothetical protein